MFCASTLTERSKCINYYLSVSQINNQYKINSLKEFKFQKFNYFTKVINLVWKREP